MSAELERVTLWEKVQWHDAVMATAGCTMSFARVARSLWGYWNPTDGVAWPSQERLARELGLSLRCVGAAIAWLERNGFIVVIIRGRSNRYALNWSVATANTGKSAPRMQHNSADRTQAESCLLSESTGLNQSKDQNLRGMHAEGVPHGGRRPVDNAALSASPSSRCGRSAEDDERPERAEPHEPGFKAGSSWQETPEPEDELPSVQLVKNLGGKPRAGTREHSIWRLQRRFEGICHKIGETPFELWEICIDEGLEDLLEMQAANSSQLGATLLEYVWPGYHERVDFFEPRGNC